MKKGITFIGAPTDLGAAHRGGKLGPTALRLGGLRSALEKLGYSVHDRGDLEGPQDITSPVDPTCRGTPEIYTWTKALKEVYLRALKEKELPILLGGDHSLSMGSIAAVAEHCASLQKPLYILWFDAHADFNTPETTVTGNIHGMPVAVITGEGPQDLLSLGHAIPMVPATHIYQIGLRFLDPLEKERIHKKKVHGYTMKTIDALGMEKVMTRALQEAQKNKGHIHVSFDVDFLDPDTAPGVGTRERGGPSYREARLCMEMLADTGLVGSVDICELNPLYDHENKTAKLVANLMSVLFGKTLL